MQRLTHRTSLASTNCRGRHRHANRSWERNPSTTEQPLSADVEIIDEPMSRSDFFREYLKGDKYEELKNTKVSNEEIQTLMDFLRQLKFNYEQSQVNERLVKGSGINKLISVSKDKISDEIINDTLESIGAVRNSAVQQRLISALDKAIDFTIEFIEDMFGITLSTTSLKKSSAPKSSVPKDLEFDTGDDTYSAGQMGKPADFSPDPSKRATPWRKKNI